MKPDHGWQYRIVKKTGRYLVDEPDVIYELCQVFFDENDHVVYFSANAILSAGSMEKLLQHIDKIKKAISAPILNFQTGEPI